MTTNLQSPLKTSYRLSSPDRPASRFTFKFFPIFVCSLIFVIFASFALRSLWSPLPSSFGRSPDFDPSLAFRSHRFHVSTQNLKEFIPDQDVLKGSAIMPKMGNATAKAELGRATWKFMHTMAQRFPEHPTADERAALKAFIYLFSRLYPCGECAQHFQLLLQQYPPQTSSRNVASLHLCSLHNLVNARLNKPEYNCTSLAENYDCGCGHDSNEMSQPSTSALSGLSEHRPA